MVRGGSKKLAYASVHPGKEGWQHRHSQAGVDAIVHWQSAIFFYPTVPPPPVKPDYFCSFTDWHTQVVGDSLFPEGQLSVDMDHICTVPSRYQLDTIRMDKLGL